MTASCLQRVIFDRVSRLCLLVHFGFAPKADLRLGDKSRRLAVYCDAITVLTHSESVSRCCG